MVDNNPKERGGLIGGLTDGIQGLFSSYSSTESFTKGLLSMGAAYQAAASISGFVSWIAEAFGLQGFADKAHNFGLRMVQKAGNLDSNTQTTGKGDDSSTPNLAQNEVVQNSVAGAAIGGMAGTTIGGLVGVFTGATAGFAAGTAVPVVGNIVGAFTGGAVGLTKGAAIGGVAGAATGATLGGGNDTSKTQSKTGIHGEAY